jgi:hypothetical protein
VAAYLHGLGVGQHQLTLLEDYSIELFFWPVEERAAVLFGQLMGLGLSAAEAARCIVEEPHSVARPSFEPAIGVLADLLASGSKEGQAGRQLLGALLRKQPAATRLLEYRAHHLQRGIDNLREVGMTQKQLAAAVARVPHLVTVALKSLRLLCLEAILQQELGCDRKLFLKLLLHLPRMHWEDHGSLRLEPAMRKRAHALAEVRGWAWSTLHSLRCADPARHRTVLQSMLMTAVWHPAELASAFLHGPPIPATLPRHHCLPLPAEVRQGGSKASGGHGAPAA